MAENQYKYRIYCFDKMDHEATYGYYDEVESYFTNSFLHFLFLIMKYHNVYDKLEINIDE